MPANKYLSYPLAGLLLLSMNGCVKLNCPLPEDLNKTLKTETLSSASASVDIKCNDMSMGNLCANRVSFYDHGKKWNLILVRNIKKPTGSFWYLPHDNENTAFESAVYATKKYGGGFLAVESGGNRYASGQDPNRNFKLSSTYTKTIFKVIDTFKAKGMPYLTLHNNKNGHMKDGGEGTVSMKVTSSHSRSYPSGKIKIGKKEGLQDEDSLVYLAGRSLEPHKIKALNAQGIHVKYELVSSSRNDNSMSNYIAIYKHQSGYVNIEVEDGDVSTQKKMIDKVMTLIYKGDLLINFLPFLSFHRPDLILVFLQWLLPCTLHFCPVMQ